MLADLTIESFQPHIGTAFTINTDEHVETFTLSEISPGKHGIPGGREPFALVFEGSSSEMMFHSQMVVLRHEVMGELAIMISPFARAEDGHFRYEAVFA